MNIGGENKIQFALMGKINSLRRKSRIGQIVIVLLFVELMFLGSFCALNLPVPTKNNLLHYVDNARVEIIESVPANLMARLAPNFDRSSLTLKPVRKTNYFLEVPLSIFAGYVLGPFLGPLVVALFLILGFLGPAVGIFILNGSAPYYLEPGFGYLIGTLVAAWSAGKITDKRLTSFRQLLAVLAGLASVHLIGLMYMFGLGLGSSVMEAHVAWRQWIFEESRNLTWYALPYDVLFSLALIGIGLPFRFVAETLCAPDIAVRAKSQPKLEEIYE